MGWFILVRGLKVAVGRSRPEKDVVEVEVMRRVLLREVSAFLSAVTSTGERV
jgi:hypothetical protein